jgi:hypothetical protein
MKKILAILVLLATIGVVFLNATNTNASETGPVGKRFDFTFPVNRAVPPFTTEQLLSVRVYSQDKKTRGTIESHDGSFSENFKMGPFSSAIIQIPSRFAITSSDVVETDRGLRIFANHEIQVHAFNEVYYDYDGLYLNTTSGAYRVLPSNVLGKDYIVASYGGWGNTFTIMGTVADTYVTITPSITVPQVSRSAPEDSVYDNSFHPAGVPYTIVVNAGDIYQLRYDNGDVRDRIGDLSGTIISANKDIAVLGANRLQYVPTGVRFADHLLTQLLPTDQWDTTYSVVPYASRGADVIRVFAKDDATQVFVNGSLACTLNAGDYHELLNVDPILIQGSNPIQVVQYAVGKTLDGQIGDPSMNSLVGDSKGRVEHRFSIPSGYEKSFINVTIDAQDINNVLLNGAPIPASEFQPIFGGRMFARIAIQSDVDYLVKTPNPSNVVVYGFSFAAGIAFNTQ